MRSFGSSPIVDVALNSVNDRTSTLPPQQLAQLRFALDQFSRRTISYQDCLAMVLPIVRATTPIDTIDTILRVPENPIPVPPSLPEERRKAGSRSKAKSWSTYEDHRLLAGIHRFGTDDWHRLALFVGNGRTKFQCCQRWSRGLDPKISKTEWTPELDQKLLELVAIHGEKNWTRVAFDFGNRCDVQCRYRYKQLQKEEQFQAKMGEARGKAAAGQIELPAKPMPPIAPPLAPWAMPQYSPYPPMPPPVYQAMPPVYPLQTAPMYLMPQRPPGFPGLYQAPGQGQQEMFPLMLQPMVMAQYQPPASAATTAQAAGPVAPAGPDKPAIPAQASVQFSFDEHLSGQSSAVDWQSLRLSPSASNFFGISPMPSLGFGT
jgi:hypothetical protein